MNILTAVTKGDKKVASFKVISEKTESNVFSNITSESSVKAESKAAKLRRLQQELTELEPADKEQLIRDLFADEIKTIIELERQTAMDKAFSDAEVINNKKIEQQHFDFVEQSTIKEEEFKRVLDVFKRDKFTVSIVQEESLLRLIFAAVLKITEKKIDDKERVSNLVDQIANDFINQLPLTLHLSTVDFNTIKELAEDKLSTLKITLVEQSELLPGSYKIQMENGNLEFDLEKNIINFKQTLLNTYSGKDRVS